MNTVLNMFPFVFCAVILVNCSASDSKQAVASSVVSVRFEEERYNFGKITQGTVVEHIFKFTNVGNDTLVIDRVETTCGCTAAILSANRIAPGDSGQIKVTFDSHGKIGSISKPVLIYSNSSNAVHQVDVYGEIEVPKDKH